MLLNFFVFISFTLQNNYYYKTLFFKKIRFLVNESNKLQTKIIEILIDKTNKEKYFFT